MSTLWRRLSTTHRVALLAVIGGFALLLPNLLTPLRAEYDALILMTLATHITDGKPPVTWGGPSVYPPGLPTLYSWMERSHLGYSATLVAANWLAYLAAAIAMGFIVRREQHSGAKWCTAALTIVFGFVTIRYMTLPMTDAVFFGVSAVSIAFLCGRSGLSWCIGLACASVAMSVRRNGAPLIPAALFAAVDWQAVATLLRDRWSRSRGIVIGFACAAFAVAAAAAFLFVRYATLGDLREMYGRDSVIHQLLHNVIERITEIGLIVCNLPLNRFPMGETANFQLAFLAGMAGWAVMLVGLWQRRRRLRAMDVYLVGFILILLVWPFDFFRFWLPVIPMLAVWAVEGFVVVFRRDWQRRLGVGCVGIYCCIGMLSHAYSLRVTFSPRAYDAVYTTGEYGKPFQVIRFGESDAELDAKMREIERVLRRFGLRKERGR